MTAQSGGDRDFCIAMLPRVSRTFAACIGLLPQPVQHRVLIAYLLCRIADTIEDCARMPAGRKHDLLAGFRASLEELGGEVPGLAEAFAEPANADELLTRDVDCTLREFRAFPRLAREAIRPWVQEMCDGMAGYARRQHRPEAFQALDRLDDLDRYCWYVAGTVGHLLTEVFRLHSPHIGAERYRQLKDRATDFGIGLQLVNIIKDVADDRVRGWSFVPRDLCAESGFTPEELLEPSRRAESDAVMRRLIDKARGHLDRALEYCLLLPARDYRLRLFCLAPLYFAIRTLARAERDPRLLDPAHKVKITRSEVYRTLAAGYVVAPCDALVTGYFRRLSATR